MVRSFGRGLRLLFAGRAWRAEPSAGSAPSWDEGVGYRSAGSGDDRAANVGDGGTELNSESDEKSKLKSPMAAWELRMGWKV